MGDAQSDEYRDACDKVAQALASYYYSQDAGEPDNEARKGYQRGLDRLVDEFRVSPEQARRDVEKLVWNHYYG